MELYSSARPEFCLGCGCGITAGDVVVPAEPIGPGGLDGSGWLLCLGCGAGLLLGQPLPAWAYAEPVPCGLDGPNEPDEPDEPDGPHGLTGAAEIEPAMPAGRAGDRAVSSIRRRAAMRAHPGSGPSGPRVQGTSLGTVGGR